MPTNNPNFQSSSQASKGAAESKGKLESGIEQGGQRAEKAIERIEKGAEQAASSAIERVREVREQATSGVMQQREMLATRIRRLGQVLHGTGETLAQEDVWVRDALEYASDRANGIAEYVSELTPGAVTDDLQSFARRRPGVFFGGAFLLGLALGRFAKSTTSSGGGGDGRFDIERYGDEGDIERYGDEGDDQRPTSRMSSRASYGDAPTPYTLQQPQRGADVASSSSSASASSSASSSSSASGRASTSSQGVQPGTSLPYVAAGSSSLGATPSSSSQGASKVPGSSTSSHPQPVKPGEGSKS